MITVAPYAVIMYNYDGIRRIGASHGQVTKKHQGVPRCFNSGEKSLACTSTFAANLKEFSQLSTGSLNTFL